MMCKCMYELRVCVKMPLSVGSCSSNSYCTGGATVYFIPLLFPLYVDLGSLFFRYSLH